jgi:hypothetical protein
MTFHLGLGLDAIVTICGLSIFVAVTTIVLFMKGGGRSGVDRWRPAILAVVADAILGLIAESVTTALRVPVVQARTQREYEQMKLARCGEGIGIAFEVCSLMVSKAYTVCMAEDREVDQDCMARELARRLARSCIPCNARPRLAADGADSSQLEHPAQPGCQRLEG